MDVMNVRWVTISDESGERQAVAGEFLLQGDELTMALATDLAIPTRPGADDARLLSRPIIAAAQVLP